LLPIPIPSNLGMPLLLPAPTCSLQTSGSSDCSRAFVFSSTQVRRLLQHVRRLVTTRPIARSTAANNSDIVRSFVKSK